jgi:hypothetical protein
MTRRERTEEWLAKADMVLADFDKYNHERLNEGLGHITAEAALEVEFIDQSNQTQKPADSLDLAKAS